MGRDKYFMAMEIPKCSDSVYQLCIFRLKYNECSSALGSCNLPMKINPFCTNGDVNKCNRFYKIIDIKNKKYIFYSCHKSCKYCLNNYEKVLDVYSKLLKSNKIYFGKELNELLELLPKSKDDDITIDDTIEFMEKLFMDMNFRMGVDI